jgi:hypothetical protein
MSKSRKKVHTTIEDAVVAIALPEEMQASAPVADLENDPTEVMNTETYLASLDDEPSVGAFESSGDELDDVGESEEAADEAVEAMPFVKLAKDQLPERGTPEREAYRKARRAAARAARKARVAA